MPFPRKYSFSSMCPNELAPVVHKSASLTIINCLWTSSLKPSSNRGVFYEIQLLLQSDVLWLDKPPLNDFFALTHHELLRSIPGWRNCDDMIFREQGYSPPLCSFQATLQIHFYRFATWRWAFCLTLFPSQSTTEMSVGLMLGRGL